MPICTKKLFAFNVLKVSINESFRRWKSLMLKKRKTEIKVNKNTPGQFTAGSYLKIFEELSMCCVKKIYFYILYSRYSSIQLFFMQNWSGNDAPTWCQFACSLKKKDVGYSGNEWMNERLFILLSYRGYFYKWEEVLDNVFR